MDWASGLALLASNAMPSAWPRRMVAAAPYVIGRCEKHLQGPVKSRWRPNSTERHRHNPSEFDTVARHISSRSGHRSDSLFLVATALLALLVCQVLLSQCLVIPQGKTHVLTHCTGQTHLDVLAVGPRTQEPTCASAGWKPPCVQLEVVTVSGCSERPGAQDFCMRCSLKHVPLSPSTNSS